MDTDVYDDVYADVGDDVDHDVIMMSSLTRSSIRPGQRPDPDIDRTQSTVKDPTRILTRPDQRLTPDSVNADPVTSPAACVTRCHALPHAPNLLVAREGACEGIFGHS